MLLSDQSAGAKIGTKSAAVINITNGKLHARCIVAVISFYIFFFTNKLSRSYPGFAMSL